ncbi:MAG: pyridoxamine 5'-phosphate oxidase family protein [Magnetovibrionaceae bacterium]
MSLGTPFHEGEKAIHEKLGLTEIDAWASRMVRPWMPEQHRLFFQNQPFVVIAARDEAGRPWATLLSGEEGFMTSPEPDRLTLAAGPVDGDALAGALIPGADIGLLGIEFATRRRNRLNGRVGRARGDGIDIAVGQSFGNCPQHIRVRTLSRVKEAKSPEAFSSAMLSAAQGDWISQADTFFIASGFRGEGEDWAFGLDVSHRGGEPGFVRVIDEQTLQFADFAGNNHFNTIGNLMSDDRAGFLFVDFSTGNLLQLSGRAEVDWHPDETERVLGAQRLITFRIEMVNEIRNAAALRWSEPAAELIPLVVTDRIREAADVVSLVLADAEGRKLPPFRAGQHLPLELSVPGLNGAVSRSYSLSGSPDAKTYRISVKRKEGGVISSFLHRDASPGVILRARKPAGRFEPATRTGPLVLIAGGIGITPLLSHLRAISESGVRREVLLIHAVRYGAAHAFRDEIAGLTAGHPSLRAVTVYSRPTLEDRNARFFDIEGRLDQAKLDAMNLHPDAEILICGPAGFAANLQECLEARGYEGDAIQSEFF